MTRQTRNLFIPNQQKPVKENFKHLHRFFCFLFFLFLASGFFLKENALARPGVGVLSVDVRYPTHGFEWLESFIHDELSLQLQLNDTFSVCSSDFMKRWKKNINHQTISENKSLAQTDFSKLKLDRVLQLSVQKVIDKLAITWILDDLNKNASTRRFRSIHSWESPDELVKHLIRDLVKKDNIFSKLIHFPQGYSWEAIRDFYQWKQRKTTVKNPAELQILVEELDLLLTNHASLAGKIHQQRALLSIQKATRNLPAHVPTLNQAETELLMVMEMYTGSAEQHTLLSLLHYLRREPLFAKQQANIGSKKNPRYGAALILYGLTIGKKPKDGAPYIKQGLELYPFIADPAPGEWQPFDLLIKDIEPWLMGAHSNAPYSYEQIMLQGQELYQARRWPEATRAFQDAMTLDPTQAEPSLYLARIHLGQNDLRQALPQLRKLKKRFPKHPDVTLYLGYAYEKITKFEEAENLYRDALTLKPEHHKALLRLGAVLIKRGKREEARSFLESLTRKYPKYTVAWWNLGILYYQMNELLLAESAWEESLRLEPDNNQVRVRLEQLRDEISMSRYNR